MPPQVGKAGETGPIVQQTPIEVEEPKSGDLQKKSAEKKEDSTASAPAVPHRASAKEASNKRAELAAEGTSQKTSLWESMKKAGNVAANLPAAAGVVAEAASESGADGIRKQKMENLARREYPQDMIPGEYFQVETITPSNTNGTKTRERVEDRSVGDVAARQYHPEQLRKSTKAGLEDRLKELNQGKELTPFEKKLVEEWDPQMKQDNPLTSVSPINSLDSKGTKGSTEVEAYMWLEVDPGIIR